MSNRASRRRYQKRRPRRIWVFSEFNRNLRPEQIAKILAAAGLEQFLREAEARKEREDQSGPREEGEEASDA